MDQVVLAKPCHGVDDVHVFQSVEASCRFVARPFRKKTQANKSQKTEAKKQGKGNQNTGSGANGTASWPNRASQ